MRVAHAPVLIGIRVRVRLEPPEEVDGPSIRKLGIRTITRGQFLAVRLASFLVDPLRNVLLLNPVGRVL